MTTARCSPRRRWRQGEPGRHHRHHRQLRHQPGAAGARRPPPPPLDLIGDAADYAYPTLRRLSRRARPGAAGAQRRLPGRPFDVARRRDGRARPAGHAPRDRRDGATRLRRGARAGAIGMSTGLDYAAGRAAPTDGDRGARRAAAAGRRASTPRICATRPSTCSTALDESLRRSAARAGVPVVISHHKTTGRANFGRTARDAAEDRPRPWRGQEIGLDAYPYIAASTVLRARAHRGRDARSSSPGRRPRPSRPAATSTTIAAAIGASPSTRRPSGCSRPARSTS